MFSEMRDVRQIKGEPKRRWFADNGLELIVWFAEQERIIGFQLCYEINKEPKALTWHEGEGYLHTGIDDGEARSGCYKAAPVLIRDGVFDKENVEKKFAASSETLPKEIADFVRKKLAEYRIAEGSITDMENNK